MLGNQKHVFPPTRGTPNWYWYVCYRVYYRLYLVYTLERRWVSPRAISRLNQNPRHQLSARFVLFFTHQRVLKPQAHWRLGRLSWLGSKSSFVSDSGGDLLCEYWVSVRDICDAGQRTCIIELQVQVRVKHQSSCKKSTPQQLVQAISSIGSCRVSNWLRYSECLAWNRVDVLEVLEQSAKVLRAGSPPEFVVDALQTQHFTQALKSPAVYDWWLGTKSSAPL